MVLKSAIILIFSTIDFFFIITLILNMTTFVRNIPTRWRVYWLFPYVSQVWHFTLLMGYFRHYRIAFVCFLCQSILLHIWPSYSLRAFGLQIFMIAFMENCGLLWVLVTTPFITLHIGTTTATTPYGWIGCLELFATPRRMGARRCDEMQTCSGSHWLSCLDCWNVVPCMYSINAWAIFFWCPSQGDVLY